MNKVDLKKELKHLYQPPSNRVVEVDVPALRYLMMDGEGDPNHAPAYQAAVETLFTLSYAIKFRVKKSAQAIDYAVMPLEGLWWADDMSTFSVHDKGSWKWTLMILQPEFVDDEVIAETIAEVKKKKDPPALAQVRLECYQEGKAAQTMHLGPFSEEGPTIARVHDFIVQHGYALAGKHHEIYLSDIRKSDPQNWKTIIRQPMT